ncbi:hypothetical protein TNCV_1102531 [Trichonephila clavipes]|nr:hypothetical protein TNCV_1102531 [Trichonephila clavipes]
MPLYKLRKPLQEKLRALRLSGLFGGWNQGVLQCLRGIVTPCSKLKEVIRKKRPGLLRSGVLLLNDNARPHSATTTPNNIATLGWECLHHPPVLISHQVT